MFLLHLFFLPNCLRWLMVIQWTWIIIIHHRWLGNTFLPLWKISFFEFICWFWWHRNNCSMHIEEWKQRKITLERRLQNQPRMFFFSKRPPATIACALTSWWTRRELLVQRGLTGALTCLGTPQHTSSPRARWVAGLKCRIHSLVVSSHRVFVYNYSALLSHVQAAITAVCFSNRPATPKFTGMITTHNSNDKVSLVAHVTLTALSRRPRQTERRFPVTLYRKIAAALFY